MLIKAEAGDKVTPGSGVPENDKVILADSDSSKTDSIVRRLNVVTFELKVISSLSRVPSSIEIVIIISKLS